MEAILKQFPDLSDNQILQFQKLQGLYEDWNDKINVISRKEIDELSYLHRLEAESGQCECMAQTQRFQQNEP